jgi:hypothetical protein
MKKVSGSALILRVGNPIIKPGPDSGVGGWAAGLVLLQQARMLCLHDYDRL